MKQFHILIAGEHEETTNVDFDRIVNTFLKDLRQAGYASISPVIVLWDVPPVSLLRIKSPVSAESPPTVPPKPPPKAKQKTKVVPSMTVPITEFSGK